jgi:tetratricopeptide (TPR) repeat protein
VVQSAWHADAMHDPAAPGAGRGGPPHRFDRDTHMLRAFIVRPFGEKEGIDFDRIEELLIAPALRELGLSGSTTQELVCGGNIREDMFGRLLKYDLVVADMSIHNANVFYELGVRHALRDRHTFLIRCQKDEVPFDLHTDRYLEYDANDPARALPRLIDGLRQTLLSDGVDSPVFRLVSGLQAQDWTRFLHVPREYTEAVAKAAKDRRSGDLDLLAGEIRDLEWEFEGLRQVGRELYSLRADPSARAVWERVAEMKRDDTEAWGRLAAIYQRLGQNADSERALDRVLDMPTLTPEHRAKLFSLRGSHEKRRWVQDWDGIDDLEQRRKAALTSPHFVSACQAYEEGFIADLNHGYSGLNALALQVVRAELAGTPDLRDDWVNLFDDEKQAYGELEDLKRRRDDLKVVVRCALESAKARAAAGEHDPWAALSLAELRLLAGQTPARVARAYCEALTDQRTLDFEAVRQKLRIFDRLACLADSAKAALAQLDQIARQLEGTTVRSGGPAPVRVLLFAGHLIDEPGRASPRFAASGEAAACEAIRRLVGLEVRAANGLVLGIAGGACGAEILFHEACAEFDAAMYSRLYLPVPPEIYVPDRVARGGNAWVERFYRLCARQANPRPRILADTMETPRWLRDRPDGGPFKRSNAWMLSNALVSGAAKVKLIAFWDGQAGDGQDGTADMVQLARGRGIEVLHLDAREILRDSQSAVPLR